MDQAKEKVGFSRFNRFPVCQRTRGLVDFYCVNVGAEIDGKNELFERPVLIFRKVGREQFYGLPLTSKEKSGPFYRLVHYGDSTGNVCLSQLRVFSTKRLIRKIDVVREGEFLALQETMANFFKGGRF
jgi:hypothetical protein